MAPETTEQPQPKKPLSSYFKVGTLPTVKIYVGPDQVLWILPEDLLCEKIDFFRAAFKGNFCEATEKEIYLVEDDPSIFGWIVGWIFGENLEYESGNCPSNKQIRSYDPTEDIAHQMELCKLWVLANKLGVKDIADDANQRLGSHCNISETDQNRLIGGPQISFEVISYTYLNTIEGSPLRETVVKNAVSKFNCFFNPSADSLVEVVHNREFMVEFLHGLKEHMNMDVDDCRNRDCSCHFPGESHSDG